jgi:hypothetical protein
VDGIYIYIYIYIYRGSCEFIVGVQKN